jgi:hypothetical protein
VVARSQFLYVALADVDADIVLIESLLPDP